MKKTVIALLTLTVLLLTAGCNAFSSAPDEKSEYQKENEAFFEEISKKPEYKELKFKNHKHKVYYKVIKNSDNPEGQKPYQNSRVRVTLSGKLITGEVFQPEQDMPLRIYDITADGRTDGIIQGLQYALQSMTIGDEWEVVVPFILGYGANSSGKVRPFSTLIFTVELKEIIEL